MKALDGTTSVERANAREAVDGYSAQTLIETCDHVLLNRLVERWWDSSESEFSTAFRDNDEGDWRKTADEQRAKQVEWLGEAIREAYASGSAVAPDCLCED